MASATVCFMCTRCEYPICSRDDLILTEVPGGTTASAFSYGLEDLLNVEDPVPCYSGDETTEVDVAVSERILTVPLPPAARLLALEAVVDSQRTQLSEMVQQDRRQREEQLHGQELEQTDTPDSQTTESPTATAAETVEADVPDEGNQQGETQNQPSLATRITRRGRVAKFRVDLVCVKADISGYGLVLCEKDRSALVPPVKEPEGVASGHVEGMVSNTAVVATPARGCLERLSSSLGGAPQNPPLATEWSSHPGNFDVEESFIRVRRRTMTAQAPWFESYSCKKRLECPDCHLGLGYLFVRKDSSIRCSSAADEIRKNAPACGDIKGVDDESQTESTEGHEPHQKRERREDAMDETHKQCPKQQPHQYQRYHHRLHEQTDSDLDASHPDTFIGLELKKIRQSTWGLVEFQKRYQQAQSLKTFRDLFPEAEELESLYGRLTALRTQSELYNSLLRKHREQNDVQIALLRSQRDRIGTYEEKLRTMQQIIEAQKIQLEMQGHQIKHQEQLVRNHESQVTTQQQQIQLERLLLNEQSRTINSQREQLTLIQAHLHAQQMKDQLQARCGVLECLLRRASHLREQHQPSASSDFSSRMTGEVGDASAPPGEDQSLPPPHLLGVIGHAREGEKTDSNRSPAECNSLGARKNDSTTETRCVSTIDVLAEERVSPHPPSEQ